MMSARRVVLLIWFVLLVAGIGVVLGTRFSADMSTFLPRGATPEQRLLSDQLRAGVTSKLLLLGISSADSAALARTSRALAAHLRNDPTLAFVANGENTLGSAERELVFRYRYLLSSATTPAHFTTTALRSALQDDLAFLGSDAGVLIKRVLPADPTGETLRVAAALAGGEGPRREHGVWFSRDGQEALLVAQTQAPGFDTDAQARTLERVRAAFAAAAGEAQAPSAVLEWSGPPVFALVARRAIESDAKHLSSAALIVVGFVLWWAYRAPRMLALALVPVASGALAGVAAVSLTFGFVHGVTLGFGTTMIGEAVDYALYFFAQRARSDAAAPTGVERIWPTLRLGTLTSVLGFSAMLFSGFPGLAQLGVYSVAGLIAALATTRWVLPALAGKTHPSVERENQRAVWAARMMRRLPSRRVSFYVVLALSALAAAWLVAKGASVWETDLAQLNPASATQSARDARLRSELGAPDTRFLLVARGADVESALQAAERASAHLEQWAAQGELAHYDTPTRILPSRATQRVRQAALPDAALLRERLKEAQHGLPFAPDVFAPFLRDVAATKSGALLEPGALAGTALAVKLDTLLTRVPEGYVAVLPLAGVSYPPRLMALVGETGDAALSLLDLKAETTTLLDRYRDEALHYAWLGVAFIVVLLALALRSTVRVARVVAPLAAAVIATCALLHFAGEKLSLFHLVALLLVVGVGSNYALFFDRQEAQAQERDRTAATLFLCSLTTLIAFGLLAFSATPVLHAIGLTVAIGALLALVFSALLARSN